MNGIFPKLFFLLVIQTLLIGCSSFSPNQSQVPTAPTAPASKMVAHNHLNLNLNLIMLYYDQLQKKTAPNLVKEYNNINESFLRNKSDENRAKYILLLSLPNTSFHNIAKALSLLNEWPQNTQLSPNFNNFKKLLTLLLTEQQYLINTINNVSQKLEVEEKRADALQRKVDDIKDMEKNLIRRDTL